MNPQALQALIIDEQCGELTPEVAELLQAHLSQNPDLRSEAERIKQTLAITERAVVMHPELARVPTADLQDDKRSKRGFAVTWLAKAASIALLASLTGAMGFIAGQRKIPPPAATASQPSPRKESPWARYRFASEQGGKGMQIVRVDSTTANDQMLR
jgi:hypothetical protein